MRNATVYYIDVFDCVLQKNSLFKFMLIIYLMKLKLKLSFSSIM